VDDEQVFVGVDAHKRSLSVGVVTGAGRSLRVRSFSNDAAGIGQVVAWLAGLEAPVGRIGVEGSAGHGRHLTGVLVAAGRDVREVPARRTAQRRRDRRRPKTDGEDALAIARATAGEPELGPAGTDAALGEQFEELSWVLCHHDVLVERRKHMLNHAEAVLCALPLELREQVGTGAAVPPRLAAAVALVPGPSRAAATQLHLLAELAGDITTCSQRIHALLGRLEQLIEACGSTLTDEVGIGVVGAARLLAEVGDPTRFRTEAAFARWCGTAPVAMSSGEGDGHPRHHRLDLMGNRKINSVLHIMSITQARCHPDARTYLATKRAQGHTAKQARRAHKTLLARRIIRRMWKDHTRHLATTQPTAA
jgi:transposase